MNLLMLQEYEMKNELIISRFLEEILSELRTLSTNDIDKLESGNYSISLKLVKNKNTGFDNTAMIQKVENSQVMEQLKKLKTRDDGYAMLSNYLKSKKEFECFAKSLEISVSKLDKTEQIKEKIIEATIGATLRSNAIQGKKV